MRFAGRVTSEYAEGGAYRLADVTGGQLKAGDDMEEVAWFTMGDELPELAFEEDLDALKVFSQRQFTALEIK